MSPSCLFRSRSASLLCEFMVVHLSAGDALLCVNHHWRGIGELRLLLLCVFSCVNWARDGAFTTGAFLTFDPHPVNSPCPSSLSPSTQSSTHPLNPLLPSTPTSPSYLVAPHTPSLGEGKCTRAASKFDRTFCGAGVVHGLFSPDLSLPD